MYEIYFQDIWKYFRTIDEAHKVIVGIYLIVYFIDQIVNLKAFKKFKSTSEALKASACIIEGKIDKSNQNFKMPINIHISFEMKYISKNKNMQYYIAMRITILVLVLQIF